MSLPSNISSSKRRPGVFATLDFVSAARGLTPGSRKIAIVGAISDDGEATANEPVQIFSESDADTQAGQGTLLALMARKAINVLNAAGVPEVQIWLAGYANAGTAEVFTLTAGGTATVGGDLVVKIAGRTLRVGVSVGDTGLTIGSNLNDEIAENAANLPFTSTQSNGVVTATSVTKGANSATMGVEIVSVPSGATLTYAQTTAGASVADIEDTLDSLTAAEYNSVILENNSAADIALAKAHVTETWGSSRKLYRHVFVGHNGSVGTVQTLSASSQSEGIVIASAEGCPTFPGEMAAAVGAYRLTNERPSANYDYSVLDLPAPTASAVYGDAEIEALLATGVTPLIPTDDGQMQIVRLVTTKYEEDGAPFENLLDLSNSYTVTFYTKLVDATLTRAIKGKSLNSELIGFLRDQIVVILKEGEGLGDLHNVADHLSDVQVEAHPTVPTRAVARVPITPVPNAHQVDATYVMIIEAATV